MIACTYEDRPGNFTGVKLLVRSLARHAPGLILRVACRNADAGFERWLTRQGNVQGVQPPAEVRGWNVKPALLRTALDDGHDTALWLDADLLTVRNPLPLLTALPEHTLLAAEVGAWEPLPGGTQRTSAWNLPVGRDMPTSVNSAVLRFHPNHRPLLERWAELLRHPDYLTAQNLSWRQRPVHLLSDQEVLTALLGSRDFADLPVHFLRRGSAIVHQGGPAGYTVGERLRQLRHTDDRPVFLHAQGLKPWNPLPWRERLWLEVSPYVCAARSYADELDESAPWLTQRGWTARSLQTLALGSPDLAGLPLALIDTLARRARARLQPSPALLPMMTPTSPTPTPNPLRRAA